MHTRDSQKTSLCTGGCISCLYKNAKNFSVKVCNEFFLNEIQCLVVRSSDSIYCSMFNVKSINDIRHSAQFWSDV